MAKKRKTEATNLVLPQDVKSAGAKIAQARNLSLSQLVADLLSREIIASASAGTLNEGQP